MPRRNQGLASADVDFETTWSVLERAFREIHTKNASALSFEELYRNAYKIVLKKKGDELYAKVAKFEEQWLGETVRLQITKLLTPGLITLDTTGRSLESTAERRISGEVFLKALKEAWDDHQVCMGMLTDVLMYMVSELPPTMRLDVTDSIGRIAYIALTTANPLSSPNQWVSSATRSSVHPSKLICQHYWTSSNALCWTRFKWTATAKRSTLT